METYNTAQGPANKKFQLANGHISTTEILFEEEQILVRIQAAGQIEFLSAEGTLLSSFSIPEETDGKEVYTEVICAAKDGSPVLKFPIVEWIDNYPHCDGEYDRWDSRTVGYYTVVYDVQANRAALCEE